MDIKVQPFTQTLFSVLTLLLVFSGLAMASGNTADVSNDIPDSSVSGPHFTGIFSNHMVLQRQHVIKVWGQAAADSRLTVSLADQSQTVAANADGYWQAEFPAMSAGGPYQLMLQDEGGKTQSIDDVLIGDVWLCSGQSNMEVKAGQVNQARNLPIQPPSSIRLMSIRQDSSVTPLTEFNFETEWKVAEPQSISDFSALCYRLAYELQKTHDIPFGMINASWGGSGIKAWIGADGLKQTGDYDRQLAWLETYSVDQSKAGAQFGEFWENWWSQASSTAAAAWTEPATQTQGWTASPAEMGNWREFGDPELADHLGMVWFRKNFNLTSAQAKQAAQLALGGIDEVDYLWVNGEFIGSTFGFGSERFYSLPQGALREGSNTVIVNVLNTWAAGGMIGPNNRLALKFADSQTLPLGEGWQYRKVPSAIGSPPRAPWESIGGLAGLANAMINPLNGLQLTGAIWYQGETDAGNPQPYQGLLSALTDDWRDRFDQALPVLIVQLPNFGPMPVAPAESGWAAIRDAQRKVAIAHPLTGLVVSIDLGDPDELHPPDKRILAARAAAVANVLAYEHNGIADGISPTAVYRQGDQVVLDFDSGADHLVVLSAAAPIAFELCGPEQGDCQYADAHIEGNRIVLDAKAFKQATRVRHCWADAPVCNLYGASGLPVSSFEVSISSDSH